MPDTASRPEGCPAYPVATSHILMVLSLEADTMWSPLGMMATEETLWSCPKKQKHKGINVQAVHCRPCDLPAAKKYYNRKLIYKPESAKEENM